MGVPATYNLRNLVERKGTTLMTALGIGLTVAVLVTALALTAGLQDIFGGTGDARQAIVMRKGVDAELSSTVSAEAYQIIRRLPGIATDDTGEPMVSPEGLTVVNLPSVDSPTGMNVSVRGMLPIGLKMRPIEITRGAQFTPGLRQVIVGESIAKRYPDAQLGKQLKFGKGVWDVVGVFKVGDSAANSEIWTDLNQLRGDFERQGGSSSLLVRMDVPLDVAIAQTAVAQREYDKAVAARKAAIARAAAADEAKADDPPAVEDPLPPALAEFRKLVADDQRLGSSVIGEKNYYAKQTQSGAPLQALGFSVAVIMAIGSAFAATNTMYAAVARRAREIGTLRALGFGRWAILRSFMLESVCLALLGGLLGVALALPVNGFTTGVGNFSTFSEVAFKFRVGPTAMITGLIFAAVIGALGGFLPAWAASRKNIVTAMRDL
jgi:ABC-type antimicrobial peptide transport system permease subunit